MTPQQLREKIQVKIIKPTDGRDFTMVSASILITTQTMLSAFESHDHFAVEAAKESVVDKLLLMVYEDQRHLLHDALMDFMRVDPFDSTAIFAAREKLYQIAKRGGITTTPKADLA